MLHVADSTLKQKILIATKMFLYERILWPKEHLMAGLVYLQCLRWALKKDK
jgi:hypothetical protein